jgi:hypothetical protein
MQFFAYSRFDDTVGEHGISASDFPIDGCM